jgi:SAM-dependent methyltransferase
MQNMKLSELVELRENLKEKFDTAPILNEINELCKNLRLSDKNLSDEFKEDLNCLITKLEGIASEVSSGPLHSVTDMLTKVEEQIGQKNQKFFADNYETELTYNSAEAIRKIRILPMPAGSHEVVVSRIGNYVSWKYPTLEIGCRDGEWTKHLVAGDPLYIVDSDPLFLDSSMSVFPVEYQQRIRTYHINNIDFKSLPQGQFGFVFSWNYLNYRGLESIKDYLREVFKLLRPGGTFMFTYNNGDLPASASYAESYFMSYIPKSILVPLCEMVGYEVTKTFDLKPTLSWIEIKKPGDLHTIKEHQTLGVVKKINSI